MAPKQAGRHVSTQLEREAQGLKWKSASTIDRQRAQKKNRKQKKRQRKQMAETADWQNHGPSSGGQWQGSARPLRPSSARRPGDLAYRAEVPHASSKLRQ